MQIEVASRVIGMSVLNRRVRGPVEGDSRLESGHFGASGSILSSSGLMDQQSKNDSLRSPVGAGLLPLQPQVVVVDSCRRPTLDDFPKHIGGVCCRFRITANAHLQALVRITHGDQSNEHCVCRTTGSTLGARSNPRGRYARSSWRRILDLGGPKRYRPEHIFSHLCLTVHRTRRGNRHGLPREVRAKVGTNVRTVARLFLNAMGEQVAVTHRRCGRIRETSGVVTTLDRSLVATASEAEEGFPRRKRVRPFHSDTDPWR